jgi:tetratricopeptide (TPR) repeat protein
LVACGENSINKTLDCVENIVVQQPDSALILLDSIKHPIKAEEQQARYILLTLYAKDLSGKDISNDSTIIYVRNYLKTTTNPKYLALSEYYLGRIYQAQGKNEQALQFYLEAKANAENTNDYDIKGLISSYIGQQYYSQRKYDNAIANFNLALKYFSKLKENSKRQISTINYIGNCLLLKDMKDSAMTRYNEALQFAQTAHDSAAVKQNLGMLHLILNEPNIAKQQLFQALHLSRDSALYSQIYVNLGKTYQSEKIMDSALYFANLALRFAKNSDNYVLTNIYHTLYGIEKERGNHKKACTYHEKYHDCVQVIDTHKNDCNIEALEEKYNSDRLRNRLMTVLYWISSVLFVMTVIAVICFIKFRLKRKNNAELQNRINESEKKATDLENQRTESENQIAELKNHIIESEKKLSDVNNICKSKDEISRQIMQKNIKKIALFDVCTDFASKKINSEKFLLLIRPLISKNEETNVYDDIDLLYKDIFNMIKMKYTELTDEELKIVCLTYIAFNNDDIALILNIHKRYIERSKSEIRKKLKIGPKKNIQIFILENMT